MYSIQPSFTKWRNTVSFLYWLNFLGYRAHLCFSFRTPEKVVVVSHLKPLYWDFESVHKTTLDILQLKNTLWRLAPQSPIFLVHIFLFLLHSRKLTCLHPHQSFNFFLLGKVNSNTNVTASSSLISVAHLSTPYIPASLYSPVSTPNDFFWYSAWKQLAAPELIPSFLLADTQYLSPQPVCLQAEQLGRQCSMFSSQLLGEGTLYVPFPSRRQSQ